MKPIYTYLDVERKVIDIIQTFVQTSDKISSTTSLDELLVNSITFIKIIITLESEFDIEFDGENLVISKFSKVEDLINYSYKKCTEDT